MGFKPAVHINLSQPELSMVTHPDTIGVIGRALVHSTQYRGGWLPKYLLNRLISPLLFTCLEFMARQTIISFSCAILVTSDITQFTRHYRSPTMCTYLELSLRLPILSLCLSTTEKIPVCRYFIH